MGDERSELAVQLERHRGELQRTFGFSNVIGKSRLMQGVLAQIKQAVRTETTVLLCGEHGTGRSLIADTIHNMSPGANGPFRRIESWDASSKDFAATLFGGGSVDGDARLSVGGGAFNTSQGGTIYLRDIAYFPAAALEQLERILDPGAAGATGRVSRHLSNTRVIASVGPNVVDGDRRGLVSGRLIELLSGVRIEVPPLRERPDDIPLLFAYFHEQFSQGRSWRLQELTPGAGKVLMAYAWPGNVEELRGLVMQFREQGHGPAVDVKDLPGSFSDGAFGVASTTAKFEGSLDASLSRFERTQILLALSRTGGQKSKAAVMLGIPRSRLYRRMVSLGIHQSNGGAKQAANPNEDNATHGSDTTESEAYRRAAESS